MPNFTAIAAVSHRLLVLYALELAVLLWGCGGTATAPAPPPPPPPPPTIAPAFPGAQGAGAETKGGRGGAICEVTNLDDTGPGSLRSCLTALGPRIVVFRVGGTIRQTSGPIRIIEPFLTIAGQTAPGGGIQLNGKDISEDMINIYTHDVVFRYIRIRKGKGPATGPDEGHPVFIAQGAFNVVLDHVSLAWTEDENFTVFGNGGPPRSITLQWSIIAEPLAQHPTNALVGAHEGTTANDITNVDFHHNFFSNSSHRNPFLRHKSGRWTSNIVYNWSFYAYQALGGLQQDIVNNLFRAGPLDPGVYEIQIAPIGGGNTASGNASVYIAGNIGPHNADPAADNWAMIREITGENGAEIGPLSTTYRRTSPMPAAGVPITPDPATNLEAIVLSTVGASQRLDCNGNWVANRDTTDARIISEYHSRTGRVPATENDVSGFPVLAAGTPCADADRDGMPDPWESANGFNANNPSDGSQDADNDGYTNVEEYLNGTNPRVAERTSTVSAGRSIDLVIAGLRLLLIAMGFF